MGLIEIIVQKFVVVDREMAYFCEFLYAQKAPPRRQHFEYNSKYENIR